jgi:hypothetical protein
LALNGLRPDAVKCEAISNEPSAKPVYRKGREGRKDGNSAFLFSFAYFASIAVKLLLIADY